MQKNDIVLIKTQPKMQFVFLVGKRCVVLEVNEEQTHAQVGELNEDGQIMGEGTVEIECLELVK